MWLQGYVVLSPHPLLDSSFAKLGWAKEHLKTLGANLIAFKRDPANRALLRADFHPQAGEYVIKVKEVPDYADFQRDVGLAVGDVLVNARAALDHAVWNIAKRHLGREPSYDKRICFPIRPSLSELENDYATTVRDQLPVSCWHVVFRAQPFNPYPGTHSDWDSQPWGRWDPAVHPHPLALLDDLVGRDKHRLITPVMLAPSEWQWTLPNAGVVPALPTNHTEILIRMQRQEEISMKPLKVGLIVDRIALPRSKPNVYDAGHVTPDVALPSTERLVPALERVLRFTERVLTEFAAALPPKR